METRDDNQFVKQAFFEHLKREGYSTEHLEVYGEYFDFFLSRLGAARLMDLEPDVIYRAALTPVEELDGEEVIEAYLGLIELFIEFWSERWEAMHPEGYSQTREPPMEGDGI